MVDVFRNFKCSVNLPIGTHKNNSFKIYSNEIIHYFNISNQLVKNTLP